jgi:uncharacterized membrane protein
MAELNKSQSPTYRPPQPRRLAPVVERNVQALYERRRREAESSSWQEQMAEIIGRFAGSMIFVYLHLAIVVFWVAANLGWVPGFPTWDESFVVLAMVASVEAIFLSTFVLIAQNRMAAAADRRADLDLQISLLSEHEITKLADLVSEIAAKLGVERNERELEEIRRDVAPETVLDEIETKESG